MDIEKIKKEIIEKEMTTQDINALMDKLPFEEWNGYRVAYNDMRYEMLENAVLKITKSVQSLQKKLHNIVSNHIFHLQSEIREISEDVEKIKKNETE